MSVVRKYQKGGELPNKNEYSDFENFLIEKINQEASKRTFTNKGEQALRAQAPIWISNIKNGLFEKDAQGNPQYYQVDKFKNTYSIDPKDNKNLNVIDLQGNSEAIQPNLFGQLNLDKKKANTWIANAFSEYQASKLNTPAPVTSEKQKVGFGPLESYMKEVVFGGNENWQNAWEDSIKGLNEQDVQKKIAKYAKEYMDWHKNKMANPEEFAEYSPIAGEQEFGTIANKIIGGEYTPEDYTKFKELGYRYGTDFSNLYTPKTEAEIAQDKVAQENENSVKYAEELTQKGIDPDVARMLATNKFTFSEIPEDLPQHVRDYITEQGAVMVTSKKGIKYLIDPSTGQPIANHDFTDPDNNYGTYIVNGEKGFQYFAPGTKGYSGANFSDPIKGGLDLRPIKGNFQNFDQWEIYGVPTMIDGKRNYVRHLHLKDTGSNNVIDLYQKSPGVYTDKNGKEYNGEITEFGEYTTPAVFPLSLNKQEISKDYDVLPSIEDQNVSLDQDETIEVGREGINKLKSTLSALKFIIENPDKYPDFDVREAATQKYTKLIKQLENPDFAFAKRRILASNKSSSHSYFDNGGITYKTGGVLKLQTGAKAKKLTAEEYNNIYKPTKPSEVPSGVPKKTGLVDVRGTWKDKNFADVASVAGSVASVLPGLGAIGGAVTTIADAYNDAQDGWSWSDTGNLAMNLGFTGLSLVGLGGLGLAGKAAKIARAAEKTENVAKVAVEGIEDVTKLSKPVQEGLLKLASGEAKSFKAAGITKEGLAELKAAHPDLASVKAITNKVPTSFLGKVTKIAEPVVEEVAEKAIKNPNMLEREFSGTIGLAKSIAGKTNLGKIGKGVGIGLGTLGIANAGVSALNVAGDFAEGGLDNVKIRDLKNTALLTSGLRGYIKSRPSMKLAKEINAAEGETKQLLQIGKDKTYAISPNFKNQDEVDEAVKRLQELKKTKERSTFLGVKHGKASEEAVTKNKEAVEEYRNALGKLIGKDVHEDLATSLMGQKVSLKQANRTAADLKVSQVEYDRARRMAEKRLNYWTPQWYKSTYKKGGVLKAAGGIKLPYDRGVNTNYDKGYFDYVQGLNQDWFNQNKTALVKAAGEYPIENLDQIKYLGTDGKYGPIHKFLDANYQQVLNAPRDNTPMKPMYSLQIGDTTPAKDKQGLAQKFVGTSIAKTNGSKQINPGFKLPKLNIDKNDIYNLIGFLGANSATNKAILSQKRAALAGIINLPYMNRQYIRQTSPNQAFYDKEAGKMTSAAGRLAGTVSDIGKATAIQLTGANKATELREKGNVLDVQLSQKLNEQQMQSDRQTDAYNLQTLGKNRAYVAEAASRMFGLDAAGTVAKNQNLQNYLQQLNRSDEIKKQEAKYRDYYNLATSNEGNDAYKQLTDLQKEAQLAKTNYEAKMGKLKVGNVQIAPWEKTSEYTNFDTRIKTIQDRIQDFQRKMYNASLAMQMPGNVAYRAKGGSLTLEERKELMRYNHELSSKDKEREDFYKIILKNNELMLKSLSRIFK